MQKPAMQHVLRTIFFVLNFSQPYAKSSLSMNPNSGHGFRLPAACSKNVTVGWASVSYTHLTLPTNHRV